MSGILVLNAGSSSLKFQLYAVDGDLLERRFKGQLDGIATAHPRLRARDGQDKVLVDQAIAPDQAMDVGQAQAVLGGWLVQHSGAPPVAVGHRVVHGGPHLTAPARIDDALLAQLEALIPLAPLHQPNNLAPILSIRSRRPDLPQVACFDTGFHRGHSAVVERYALPEALYSKGVRRYGFHGLSYEFVAGRLPQAAPDIAKGRVVILHLGSGASACAVDNGRSVDSSMGFSTLDGLPMGTRPGQLDPGVVLFLSATGMSTAEIEHLLYYESGMKGLSGLSGDMRDLLASDAPAARLALDYFAHRAASAIASLGSSMGGLDGIVFTAGVGENAAPIRAAICDRCAWLGVRLDAEANARHGPLITAPGSGLPAYVIPTNEERMIAHHTLELLRASGELA